MTKEFDILHANKTWSIVPFHNGNKAIGCKWVYRIKYKIYGSIERYKVRLVV